jgi:catechol-2,3-dioxygenase
MGNDEEWSSAAMIESVSAVTLATHDMAPAVAFYRMLGFEIIR